MAVALFITTIQVPRSPAIRVSADGVRLSLSAFSQQLTWEQLGAPTTGAILTASISGTTLTISSYQSYSSTPLSLGLA